QPGHTVSLEPFATPSRLSQRRWFDMAIAGLGPSVRCAIACIAVALLSVFAFGQLFTTFPIYDDEGYFLLACRDFLSGRALYDQVFAIYGPMTFLLTAIVAGLDAGRVTNDWLRWTTLPAWLAIAALLGGVVWRWTDRFAPALTTFLLIGSNLRLLAPRVGHPQLWFLCAAAVLLWLGVDWDSRSGARRALWIGALVAMILLLKINLGLFAVVVVTLVIGHRARGRIAVLTTCGALTLATAFGVAL